MSKRARVVLENNTAFKLLTRPQYLVIPELASLAARLPDIPSCCGGGQRQQSVNDVMNQLKHTVATLSSASKATLKRLLNTDEVKVVYRYGAEVRTASF